MMQRSVWRRTLVRGAQKAFTTIVRVVPRTIREPWERILREQERRSIRQALDEEFDAIHGVDTSGVITPDRLHIDVALRACGHSYQSFPTETFYAVMSQFSLEYEKTTFIDLGSGKGRVLLMASELAFRRILGVELSSELHDIAVRNIKKYRSSTQRCSTIESVCMSAADCVLPLEPLVLFLYNPFEGAVMESVVENVRKSLAASHRPLWVVYVNPTQAFRWDAASELVRFRVHQPVWESVAAWRTSSSVDCQHVVATETA